MSELALYPAARGNVTYENTANIASYQQDGLLTYKGWQYTGWYRADRTAVNVFTGSIFEIGRARPPRARLPRVYRPAPRRFCRTCCCVCPTDSNHDAVSTSPAARDRRAASSKT